MAAIKKRGRAGLARAAIVIHSLLSPVSARCLFSHCVTLARRIYLIILILPPQKDTCQQATAAPNLGLFFFFLKMQIASICGLLLSPSG